MMNITLQPEQERFIQEQLACGRIQSVDDFLSQAFSLMQVQFQSDEVWLTELRESLVEAQAELDRGEGVPLETVMADFQEKFRRAQAS
jgi:antitoxin ParD1/3/4